MKPEHNARRTIIREWMLLPRDKRQTKLQATDFTMKALERHKFRCAGVPQQRVMAWLLPRTGRA